MIPRVSPAWLWAPQDQPSSRGVYASMISLGTVVRGMVLRLPVALAPSRPSASASATRPKPSPPSSSSRSVNLPPSPPLVRHGLAPPRRPGRHGNRCRPHQHVPPHWRRGSHGHIHDRSRLVGYRQVLPAYIRSAAEEPGLKGAPMTV
jgi:hypothetical protein